MDLPLPDGPRIATASPGAIVSDTPSSAGGPSSYLRLTSRSSITGTVMVDLLRFVRVCGGLTLGRLPEPGASAAGGIFGTAHG